MLQRRRIHVKKPKLKYKTKKVAKSPSPSLPSPPPPPLLPPQGPWPRLDDTILPSSAPSSLNLLKASDILGHETYKSSLHTLQNLGVKTFHHHTHILLPLLNLIQAKTYLEIGSFAGASAALATYAPTVTDVYAIDTCEAFPNQEQLIRKAFEAHHHSESKAKFTFFPTSSQDRTLLRHLYADKRAPFIDLLFVDGDHSFQGLAKDIEQYMALVRPGGIIVIDDYQDSKSCPEVRRCVDTLLSRWKTLYGLSVIGSLPNHAQAFTNGSPNLEHFNNEFILQKPYLRVPESETKTIGIPIATYQRANGSTPGKLLRTLAAVKQQTYSSWFIVLIGDAYTNTDEFLALAARAGIPPQKIVSVNLPIACEREFIVGQPSQINSLLWKLGGATSMNYGLELCRAAGLSLIAHLDDDDTWLPGHVGLLIQNLSKYPQTVVSYSKGKEAATNLVLPAENGPDTLPVRLYNNFHSCVLWDVSQIPLRYNIYQTYPADADMWERMRSYCTAKGLRMVYCPIITVTKN